MISTALLHHTQTDSFFRRALESLFGHSRGTHAPVHALVLLALSLVPSAWAQTVPAPESDALAFVNVTVLPMDGARVLSDQTVLVKAGRIVALGASDFVPVPAEAEIIDGSGKTLLPGLIDGHIHLRGADSTGLMRYVQVGITTARKMNGRPFILNWRDRIEEGQLLGPALVVASPTIANWSSPREGYLTPETPAEADSTVRRFVEAGYDWIKVYSFIPSEIYHAVVDAAERYGIPVGGHAPLSVSFDEALRMRSLEHLLRYTDSLMTEEARRLDEQDFRGVFHAVEFDESGLPAMAEATRNAGVWSCPTIHFFDYNLPAPQAQESWERPELRAMGHENRLKIIRALHEAGARLLVCTDSDAGDDLSADAIYDEIEAMHEAGMTRYEVLRAATADAAEFLDESAVGTIAVGKRADLLLVECNPLNNLACLRELDIVLSRERPIRNPYSLSN